RYRLLLSYLVVTGSVLGIFAFTMYGIVARDRQHQLNLQIRQLATVAAVSFDTIQHEHEELFQEAEYSDYVESRSLDPSGFISLSDLMEKYQTHSSSFDITPVQGSATTSLPGLHPLTPRHQGIEWFDSQKLPLVREGDRFPSMPLPSEIAPDGEWIQTKDLRSFVLPISVAVSSTETTVLGYVRASESLVPLTTELEHFRQQLALGVLLVSGLVTIGGIWLTHQSLRPVLASFEQLKQFTSDASHELRNPLTAIRASIAVLQSHPERVHPSDVQKLQAIASASEQMSQLVDDLLLLTRLDRQTHDKHTWRIIPLDELLEELGHLYGDRASQSDLTLIVDALTPVTIQGDADQLQRLFTNLLTNALKYTPAGGHVTVTLRTSGAYALASIQDTGIGIAADQLPHIFDRFWRADHARTFDRGGSGLGLAIAQSIARSHLGNITVSSDLGHGSCFQVKLPIYPG
ncbi:MAG: HAMP domain-containing sensor histidine kinase, partial [Leptolyngbyaceae bacterium]|nr:HAMP domain-containing sensor histidine kinase [Leptolyngbyaceae bacterium]